MKRILFVYAAVLFTVLGCGGDGDSTTQTQSNAISCELIDDDLFGSAQPGHTVNFQAIVTGANGPISIQAFDPGQNGTALAFPNSLASLDAPSLNAQVSYSAPGTPTVTIQIVDSSFAVATCTDTITVSGASSPTPTPTSTPVASMSCSLSIAAKDASLGPVHYEQYVVTASATNAANPRLVGVSVDGVTSAQISKNGLQTVLAFVNGEPLQPHQAGVTFHAVITDDSGAFANCSTSSTVWAY